MGKGYAMQSGGYKIRAMKMSEFDAVVKLIYDSVHTLCVKEYTPEELDAWVPKNMSAPAFRASLGRCHAIVAVDGGEIVGFMSTERSGYVNRLYTRPDYIKKGVASALLENTENWGRRIGIRHLVLEASKSAEGFYRKRGFVRVGTVSSLKNDIRFVSAKMRKDLV